MFSGKDSTITVRDLLKWANRINKESNSELAVIALEGFLVLGERSRNTQDKMFIKQTLERHFKVIIDLDNFYEQYFDKYLSKVFETLPKELNLPKIIMS